MHPLTKCPWPDGTDLESCIWKTSTLSIAYIVRLSIATFGAYYATV